MRPVRHERRQAWVHPYSTPTTASRSVKLESGDVLIDICLSIS